MTADKNVGRGWGETAPDYRHPPVASVPLAFPFQLMGVTIDRLDLSPPAYGDLLRLWAAGELTAHDIVAVLSGAPPVVIHALRWPDMEDALKAGVALLPPDIAEAVTGPSPPVSGSEEAPPAADAPAIAEEPSAAAGEDQGDDVGAELGIEPPNHADYQTEV